MPLTKSFAELVQSRVSRDPDFATALLSEGIDKSYLSSVMASIHETADGLHAAGVMNKQTVREFDDACLTPDEIRLRRERNRAR